MEYGIRQYEGQVIDQGKYGDNWVRLLENDVEVICTLGRRLGADAVLLGEMLAVDKGRGGSQLLGYIRTYLVDVRTRKVFFAKSTSAGELARFVLPRVLRNLVQQYEKEVGDGL